MKINIPSSCPLFQGAGSSSAVDKLLKKASCVIFVVPACCRYIFLKIHIYIYTPMFIAYIYLVFLHSVIVLPRRPSFLLLDLIFKGLGTGFS